MENQDLAAILMSQATLGDPIRYANLLKASKSDEISSLRELLPKMKKQLESFEKVEKHTKELRKQVSGEGYARRRKDSKKIFGALDQQKDSLQGPEVDLSVILHGHFQHITAMYSNLVQGVEMICNAKMITFDESLSAWTENLEQSVNELGQERVNALFGKVNEAKQEALKSLSMEQRVNQGAQASFVHGVSTLERVIKDYDNYTAYMQRIFESYYERLRHRHSNGMIIAEYNEEPSVTLTDIAVLVWENIDKVGEIEDGHDENEISTYTLHRAHVMIEAAKNIEVWPWIIDPGKNLIRWVKEALITVTSIRDFIINVKQMLGESTWRLLSTDPKRSCSDFCDVLESLDLSQIIQRPPERAFSKTEKFAMNHRNESIQKVADMLISGNSLTGIVDEIIKLKVEEHNYFVNENSFYVCRIGTGNPFAGEAPGAIEVIPGEKPNASLENIWGTGFDEFRDFIDGMDEARRWQPLFLSTSPSQSTDKNNMLLVGPQGCGKTQLMRSLGAADNNVTIFAVGSDFLTCWSGESNKNPKRLFDEAVKLHKSSGRPVHILIDEIDMVLNDDRSTGTRVNLSLEFQNLMDGVVAYPGISVVGATNHPQRIPTPMLRRFAKVMVVGELSEEDSNKILKHYLETFLPCEGGGFTDEQYSVWSKRLDGATGDVLRKAVDRVWLKLMRTVVADYKEVAEEALAFLEEAHGDNFDVSSLTDAERGHVKELVSKVIQVKSTDVDQEIEETLNNFAIQQQIKVAKETYKNSHLLLKKQKMSGGILGF